MPRHWIGVVAADHAVIAAAEGVCHLSLGGRTTIAALEPGDRVAFYAPRTGFREGPRVQAFVAIAVIEGKALWQREWSNSDLLSWVRMAIYEQGLAPAPIRPLLPGFSFIPDARYWGIAFRKGLLEVASSDLDLIAATMAARA